MPSSIVTDTNTFSAGKSLKGYLPTLDGWRAVAILAVLLDHGTAELNWIPKSQYFRTGPNGVSLFFAISGFLICSRLLEEESVRSRISLKDFYVRRACRILPPALAYLVVIGLLGIAGCILVTPIEWWSCIFFFRNYLPYSEITRGWGGYTIHYWSLAVEEHFYLLWPALLFLAGRMRARYVASALVISVAIWRWWDFHHQVFNKLVPGLLWPSRTDIRLDGLLLGCLAALLLAEAKNRDWMVRNVPTYIFAILIFIYALFQIIPGKHLYSVWESMILAIVVAWTVIC
ncbi:MAG TPA: acyltransferase, partial [Terriglobales bacterium]|nr:acyltransferase [Terriglobales bacterium]